ncbi:hypothetical protein Hamer_G007959 [Homarus americanus]|uniref:Endonuclease/exonuclease/phosphatase domain-containing protein n=1 Tax=Homarus americanus TaxID=6706 RepID=A0A8J5MT38_HOMAM|nr:hypothetical protein Hamer_G007959 [Homarus americanus]
MGDSERRFTTLGNIAVGNSDKEDIAKTMIVAMLSSMLSNLKQQGHSVYTSQQAIESNRKEYCRPSGKFTKPAGEEQRPIEQDKGEKVITCISNCPTKTDSPVEPQSARKDWLRDRLENLSRKCITILQKAGELLTQATQELVLIAGDFNAHHPTIISTTRMNLDGRHLVEVLTDILGGTLDLTFISTELVPVAQWEMDDELTTEDIDQLNQDLTGAIQHAAEKAIPKTNPTNRHHKDYWLYNDEVREQNHRINTFRRHLRQYPSPEGVKLLRAAVQHARQITQKIREDKWLEWCATFNAHTSLSELWRKFRIATGKLSRSPAHPSHYRKQIAWQSTLQNARHQLNYLLK